ncbi:transglutaminase-like domain-containing protein [Actinomadura sp. HBU206391]|uniref:transglutaminase-like domain-containing protein n=1 Tax=Actinomadura sp. HBU206391 TaxID=2731692 RepID=UPI00164EF5EB|nr:transglutaminase-like domain-containing protein [Actinomadura sp. HBU206391]MBC6459341.1 transglutaminase domain-containing protein [Actinomadura sp. HBU206391]
MTALSRTVPAQPGHSATRRAPGVKGALAVLAAVAAAAGAWSALLGGAVLRVVPVAIAAAALTVLRPAPRLNAALLAGWLPTAVVIAGVPGERWWPDQWMQLLRDLSDGASMLATLGPGRVEGDPWPVAVWLLLTGAVWLAAGAMGAARTAPGSLRTIAFALLVAPWALAVAVRQSDDAAWQGAVILFAACLWFAPRHASAVPVLALGTGAALVSALTAHALGPKEPWLALDDVFKREAQFTRLDTTQTYGPLRGRRSGATMLQVTAPEPALWRMQVLERYSYRGWEVSSRSGVELPEPAAQPVDIDVKVEGLRSDMVVSPGAIRSVTAEGKSSEGHGASRRLTPVPKRGDSYSVRANVVRATADQLRAAPPPSDPRIEDYTRLWSRYGTQGRVDWFGAPPYRSPRESRRYVASQMEQIDGSAFQAVLELSQRLTAGTRNQFEVVERVQRYLTEGDRFRYTTDVPRAGRYPLMDFLLYDRAGYCQHFAGAAALLLRMAGVPTRVAVGFATGLRAGDGHYSVRDADAHAWIEVYFQNYGWVPFNPTPSAADAEIPEELDPLTPPAEAGRDATAATAWAGAAIPLVLTLGVVAVVRRRRRDPRTELGELLERLARQTGAQVEPSTTLSELRGRLARIGPRSAALATEAEHARFAPDSERARGHPWIRMARALVADLGTARAVLILLTPVRRPFHSVAPGPLRTRLRAASPTRVRARLRARRPRT